MAELGATRLTLLDWGKRLDPNGNIARITEMLSKKSPLLQDLQVIEGNLPTGHQYTHRTGLPEPSYRLINQGVPPTKSQTSQLTEQASILEDRSEVDRDLVILNGNSASFRLSEASAHIEGMSQKTETTIFYGNAGTEPEKFNGLATRFSSISAANGKNIVDAGGTGSDNASIWFIGHGTGFHGFYPKGSQAGIQHEDLGVQDAFDASNNRFRAYIDWFQIKLGTALADWRSVVRIANIDISNLQSGSGAADLIKMMSRAFARVESPSNVKIYMNRTVFQGLEEQRYDAVKAGGGLTYMTVDGEERPVWRGMQIRISDALLNTEGRVT